MLCPAVKVQVTVQPLMGYGELLVTVTVAPKSGGLSDGVCQAIVYATPHEAPVSAGAPVLFTASAVTVAAISAAAPARLPGRRREMAMSAPLVPAKTAAGARRCEPARGLRSVSPSRPARHHYRGPPQLRRGRPCWQASQGSSRSGAPRV